MARLNVRTMASADEDNEHSSDIVLLIGVTEDVFRSYHGYAIMFSSQTLSLDG